MFKMKPLHFEVYYQSPLYPSLFCIHLYVWLINLMYVCVLYVYPRVPVEARRLLRCCRTSCKLSCGFREIKSKFSEIVESALNCWSISHSCHFIFQNIFSLVLHFQSKSFSEECQHPCLLSVDVTEHHRQMVFIIK